MNTTFVSLLADKEIIYYFKCVGCNNIVFYLEYNWSGFAY